MSYFVLYYQLEETPRTIGAQTRRNKRVAPKPTACSFAFLVSLLHNVLGVTMAPRRKLCTCSKCLLHTCLDKNKPRSGRLQYPQVIKKHLLADRLRHATEAEENHPQGLDSEDEQSEDERLVLAALLSTEGMDPEVEGELFLKSRCLECVLPRYMSTSRASLPSAHEI